MATAGEMAQDTARALDALVQARQHFAARDQADTLRHGKPVRSAVLTAIEYGEKALERVLAALANQDPQPEVGRDGGPI